jgi:hypothetical protein
MRQGLGWIRTAWRSAAYLRGHLASLTALTAGDAQLEGDVGDHLGISSAVSAVVAYCQHRFLLSGGRNPLETRILPPPWAAALLGLDR